MMSLGGRIFLWLFYFPLQTFLKYLFFFHPKVQARLAFEFKNKTSPGCRSFKVSGQTADLCFEFSSEGEFQQVASLIEDALRAHKKLELVFFSPSVEKTIMDLFHRYPDQIRYLRYPLFNLTFSSWITSSTLIMVRYDLFPEFLMWALHSKHKLYLVWVTFKKERIAEKNVSLIKRAFLMKADKILYASEEDLIFGNRMGLAGHFYDFRMEQIKRRLDSRDEKFAHSFPDYEQFFSFIKQFPRHKRLIMGNAWPDDLSLLETLPEDVLLVIVPHKLGHEIIYEMEQRLKSRGRDPSLIREGEQLTSLSRTILIIKKGILCELYSDFAKAYVGGGFGVSIHSMLEPLVAGCENLSCGPRNHRSTEFDLARLLGHLKVLRDPHDFECWMDENIVSDKIQDKLKSHIKNYAHYRKEIIAC